MNLEIQLISRPEMPDTPMQEVSAILAEKFPHDGEMTVTANARSGVVTIALNQAQLTDAQRDWLHMTPFAARYIDSYRVEQLERWTLQAAGDHAEDRYGDIEETATSAEALWFLAVVNARAGEQVERATAALERIATVLEAWRQQGKSS